jgi:hypothetical protein
MAGAVVFSRRTVEIVLGLFLVLLVPFQLSMYHKHHPLHAVQHPSVDRHEALHTAAVPPAPESPPEDESRVEAVLACYDNPHHCSAVRPNKNDCYSNKTISQQLCKVRGAAARQPHQHCPRAREGLRATAGSRAPAPHTRHCCPLRAALPASC